MKREALLTADSRLHEIQTLQRAREEIVRLRKELKAGYYSIRSREYRLPKYPYHIPSNINYNIIHT